MWFCGSSLIPVSRCVCSVGWGPCSRSTFLMHGCCSRARLLPGPWKTGDVCSWCFPLCACGGMGGNGWRGEKLNNTVLAGGCPQRELPSGWGGWGEGNGSDEGMEQGWGGDGTGVMRGWKWWGEGNGSNDLEWDWWSDGTGLMRGEGGAGAQIAPSQPVAVPGSSWMLPLAVEQLPGIWYRLKNRTGCSSAELWTGPDLMQIFVFSVFRRNQTFSIFYKLFSKGLLCFIGLPAYSDSFFIFLLGSFASFLLKYFIYSLLIFL